MSENRDKYFCDALEKRFSSEADKPLLQALKALTCITKEEANIFKRVTTYEVFNPRRTLALFYEKCSKVTTPGVLKVPCVGDDGEVSELSIDKAGNFQRDLEFFIAIYCTRGTNLINIYERSSDVLRAVIKTKAKIYEMPYDSKTAKKKKDKEAGGRVARDNITIGRLAACLPHLVCEMYSHGGARTPVEFPQEKAEAWKKFPVGIRHNLLGGVWPDTKQFPREIPYLMAHLFHKKVNLKMKRLSLQTIKQNQDILLESSIYGDYFKAKCLEGVGLPIKIKGTEGSEPLCVEATDSWVWEVFEDMTAYWLALEASERDAASLGATDEQLC